MHHKKSNLPNNNNKIERNFKLLVRGGDTTTREEIGFFWESELGQISNQV